MGMTVVATQTFGTNLSRQPPAIRGLANLACIALCLTTMLALRH